MRAASLPILGTTILGALLICAPAFSGIDLVTSPGDGGDEIKLEDGEYIPSSGTQTRISDDEIDEIMLACDTLAAHPGNDENPEGINGVAFGDLDGSKALPACLKAVEVAPDIKRLRYQLSRAKQASGQGLDAITDLRALAGENYVPAINNLGATYQLGIGVPKDYAKAVEWYENAAGKGFIPSMAVVGWMHHQGLGTPKDDEAALRWYRKAAAGGSASAMHNIGFMYHNGWAVDVDPKLAADWFRKAAENGFGQAMSMTAWTYQVGRGVPADGVKAINWYEKAAQIGEISAMAALGGFYDTGGAGISKQPEKAAEWLLRSLTAGNKGTRDLLVETSDKLQPETRRAVQERLTEMGYDPGPADGVFGNKTRNAVNAAFTAP